MQIKVAKMWSISFFTTNSAFVLKWMRTVAIFDTDGQNFCRVLDFYQPL